MNLIHDLALILVVAGVVTLLFKWLKQPLVLGYIVAGFLVSPNMPYTMSVVDKANIQELADIGVVFLLFSLGLDFSFKKIIKQGISPVIAALSIIFAMMVLGILTGHAFGWKTMDCIFLGGMLAMSSTTIIYKAYSDMGLRQQSFAQTVMSVLILEDILAIVMMVMLSAIANGNSPDGGQMLQSILRIVFFLVLWFVVGIFLIPLLLKKTRRLMTAETLLIVALGLCCLMAEISVRVGFSSAFGAFVMGSILAETVEADKILRVVEPVKNLFGAIFFVSVGMLVDPHILYQYALPIVALVLVVIIGQCVFGTAGYLLSGQTLKAALRCGFSMTQIGEFAFIIASLGLSLGVISKFLYPVVVAVSVITTFTTPYMIRAAVPAYGLLEKTMPKRWLTRLDNATEGKPSTDATRLAWHALLRQMAVNTLIYTILCIAITFFGLTLLLPFCRHILPHWWANGVCGVVLITCMAPFLRAMVVKKDHSAEWQQLWNENPLNRFPLLFTVLVRLGIAAAFVFYVLNYLTRFSNAFMITLALVIISLMVVSRRLKQRSIRLEKVFTDNLRSREIAAQVNGQEKPKYAERLADRNIHIGDFEVNEDSAWAGQSLKALRLPQRFSITVSSILRGHHRLNIPDGETVIYPGDVMQVIGDDNQLKQFADALGSELLPEDVDIERREMKLRRIILEEGNALIGKTLRNSGIREQYNCMLVGVEEGQDSLDKPDPSREFREGDVLWVVGEESALHQLAKCER